MAYNGADALAELVEHDRSVVVGILGGSAGTTRDTFELLAQAQRHGGRVALFGRKIQRSESQLDLVGLMRPVLRGELTPAEAVRAYHDALAAAGIAPQRALEADLEVTEPALRGE
jgi:shikimate kinase